MSETIDGRTLRAQVQRAERRARILQSALEVFARKGYHHTSVSDVVEAAGIARGTFYLYFDGKNAIFLELLDQLLGHLSANVQGIQSGPGTPAVQIQLRRIVSRIVDTVAQNRELTRILFREAIGLDEAVDLKLREFYDRIQRFIAHALELGHDMGLVRTIDVDVTATCILGSIRQVFDQNLLSNQKDGFDAERITDAILEHSLRGVLAPGVP